MRKCARCGQLLPLDFFYKDRHGRYSARCRSCHGIVLRNCRHCGAKFEGLAGRHFCSPTCRRAHRPPTYKICAFCGRQFGPVSHLERQFCSRMCKVQAQTTGRKTIRKTHRRARSAQSLLRYHVLAGHIHRPAACEACGSSDKRIEAAHYDYAQPLRVRWLCVSCHRKWDKRFPKNATYVASISQAEAAV